MDLDLILRTSALLAIAAGLSALLRKAAPATRHLVWHLAIVLVILAPLLGPLVPNFRVPNVPGVPEVLFESRMATMPQVQQSTTDTRGTVGTVGTVGTLGTLGTIGTIGTLSWFTLCWILSGRSVSRGSRPARAEWISEARQVAARLGFAGVVDVRESVAGGSPHVAGLFRAVVMMPASADRWTSDERKAAFVHELTHIRRHDRRTQAIAQLACAIHWFNPLVWYAAAALARERERACDDEVLRVGVKPSAYAALLLDLARRPATWTPATALSMARPSAIEGRLLMILADVGRTPRRTTRWVVGAAIAALTTVVLGAQPAGPDSEAPQQADTGKASTPGPIVKPQEVMQLDAVQNVGGLTDILVRALSDDSAQVREQATLGLALTPGNAVIDPLLTAMADADGQVREKAAIALGASGDARAITALTKATTDPDSQVREKAIAGLVLLGLRR